MHGAHKDLTTLVKKRKHFTLPLFLSLRKQIRAADPVISKLLATVMSVGPFSFLFLFVWY